MEHGSESNGHLHACRNGRKGIVLDPEWVGLEFDVRLWSYDDAERETGLDTRTVWRALRGQTVSRESIKRLLRGFAINPPLSALEQALPLTKRQLLAERRGPVADYQPSYLREA